MVSLLGGGLTVVHRLHSYFRRGDNMPFGIYQSMHVERIIGRI